jgi:hypothetical protein
MFCELCSIIQEGSAIGAGRSGGPLVIPLHHWVTSPTLALYLLGKGVSQEEIVGNIKKTMAQHFRREDAAVATNVLARKAETIEKGPLTDMILKATEPMMTNALSKRAVHAYREMKAGKSLSEVIGDVQKSQIESLSGAVAKAMSKRLNRDIEYIRFKAVRPGSGRRSHAFAQRHFAFDAYVDVEVKIDGKVYELENVLAKAAPEALMREDRETIDAISAVSPAIIELLCSGASAMDVVVCACMAAALGADPKEAAEKAAGAANVLLALPLPSLGKATELASEIMKGLDF